jgi:hypothetical protein
MSWIETGIKELEDWEQSVLSSLSQFLSPDEITNYLDEYQRDKRFSSERAEEGEDQFEPGTFSAIASISLIRSLLEEIKQPLPENVPLEMAARFAVLTFRAGFITGFVSPSLGMKALKPFAKTRFAQMQNQPITRDRINIAKDNIFEELDGYVNAKNHSPLNLFSFISYLESRGFEIDRVKKTIDSRDWKTKKRFGTIDNWRREFEKTSG